MDFDQKEKEFEEQINNLPRKTFEEVFAQIEPRLKKKSQKLMTPKKLRAILATAASMILVLTGSLIGYFWSNNTPNPPEYWYAETDVTRTQCDYEDLLIIDNLLLPDLSLLEEIKYQIGRHNETNELVYFIVNGIYDNGTSFRELEFYIILKKEFRKENGESYNNLPNSFLIDNKNIFFSESTYIEPFFFYKISFTVGDIRYYFDYNTIEENDVDTFFQEFLK